MTEKKITRIAVPGVRFDPKNEVFLLKDEDYTTAKLITWMLLGNPEVKFANDTMSHPDIKEVIIKIEMHESSSMTSVEALKKAFVNLHAQFEHILKKFEKKATEFEIQEEIRKQKEAEEEAKRS